MSPRERIEDAIILGLRLTGGINQEDFLNRFGVDIMEEYRNVIVSCQDQGLLEINDDHICLTKTAYFLSNQVFRQFMNG
jgi:oxygen-independent coproporphyrinogen-3 oxidase